VARFNIKIVEHEGNFYCDSAQSILEGMLRANNRVESADCKVIPVGCRGGGCGVCKIEVVSGGFVPKVMSRSHISEEDQCEGKVLACRIMPTSDMELRVIGGVKRVLACRQAEICNGFIQ
jgi:ferredoxin